MAYYDNKGLWNTYIKPIIYPMGIKYLDIVKQSPKNKGKRLKRLEKYLDKFNKKRFEMRYRKRKRKR